MGRTDIKKLTDQCQVLIRVPKKNKEGTGIECDRGGGVFR